MTTEQVVTSPQMEQVIKQLALRHSVVCPCQGTRLSVALPDRTDRWLIANLSGHRISVTHCWVEADGGLSPDLEMVFAFHASGWEPIELVYSDEVWETYVQAAEAAGMSVYDEQGGISFVHFTEYWAHQLQQQGWLEHSLSGEEGKGDSQSQNPDPVWFRLAGCQSRNHVHCYGELWHCAACGKSVCYAEGSDDHPELCDDCWSRHQETEEELDVPF